LRRLICKELHVAACNGNVIEVRHHRKVLVREARLMTAIVDSILLLLSVSLIAAAWWLSF